MIINLLTAEFNKLFKRKNFYIGLSFVILASLVNIIIALFTHPNYTHLAGPELQVLMLRFISNKFVAIIAVFVITVFIAGTNGNTVKNAITIGYTRLDVYYSKIILGCAVITLLLFASMIATFLFSAIWLHETFTVEIFWGALIRFSLMYMLYICLYIISMTMCLVMGYNMLFAIVYFILFLVLTQIIETTTTFDTVPNILAQLTITHQFDQIIAVNNRFAMWPYVVGCTIAYSTIALVVGSLVLNRKDIR